MTDWSRVEKLRSKGRSWAEVARDRRVGFRAPTGADPGVALQALYGRQRSSRTRRKRDRRPSSRSGADGPAPGSRSRWRTLLAAAAGVAVLVVVVVLVLLYVTTPPVVPALVSYCGGEGTVTHYHPLLVIDVNGAQQPLPYDASQTADIGFLDSPGFTNATFYCPAGAIHALHTHDGSGIIHVELPSSLANDAPTLGEFFQIWGEPLSTSTVWTYTGSVHAVVRNAVAGSVTDYSGDPARIPFFPASCGPTCDPVAIPPSLIFGGAYGDGASGGFYTGEIIWLNVTTTATPGTAAAVGSAGAPRAPPLLPLESASPATMPAGAFGTTRVVADPFPTVVMAARPTQSSSPT